MYHEHYGHLCACQQSNPVFMLGQDSEELTQSSSTPKLSKPGRQGKHNYRERIKFEDGIHYSLIGRVVT